MKISRSCLIERAADPADSFRPTLAHVLIEGIEPPFVSGSRGEFNGRATAANGFLLVTVPVQLDEDDVLGLVPAELFKKARAMSKKSKYGYGDVAEIRLGREHYTMPDATLVPRQPSTLADADEKLRMTYPDYRRLIPQRNTEKLVTPAFSINAKLLLTAQEAMGVDGVHLQHVLVTKYNASNTMDTGAVPKPQVTSTPLVVETEEAVEGELIPPFAVLMPMMLPPGKWDDVEEHKPAPAPVEVPA